MRHQPRITLVALWSVFFSLNVMLTACGSGSIASGTPIHTPVAAQTPTIYTKPTFPIPTVTPFETHTVTPSGSLPCSPNTVFVTPPGPLPPHIVLPLHTVVGSYPQGIMAGALNYSLCTPGSTTADITQFMSTALPANGWQPYNTSDVSYCNQPKYDWYQGTYGIVLVIDSQNLPNWYIEACPYINDPNHT